MAGRDGGRSSGRVAVDEATPRRGLKTVWSNRRDSNGSDEDSGARTGRERPGAPRVEGDAAERTDRREGRWAPIFRQFLKFITVGLLNTAVELVVYNALLLIHPAHNARILTLYSTIGVVAAIINSYVWNSRWAFKEARDRRGHSTLRQQVLFLIQALINIGINDIVTVGLTPALVAALPVPIVISQNMAKVGAMATSSLSSYAMLRLVVFAS